MTPNQQEQSENGGGRDIAECLGSNLKRLRQQRGWTQGELAKRANLSQGFLQSLEAGRRWIGPATIRALAIELGVTQSELFTDCEEQRRPDRIALLRWVGEEMGVEAPEEIWKKLRLTR